MGDGGIICGSKCGWLMGLAVQTMTPEHKAKRA